MDRVGPSLEGDWFIANDRLSPLGHITHFITETTKATGGKEALSPFDCSTCALSLDMLPSSPRLPAPHSESRVPPCPRGCAFRCLRDLLVTWTSPEAVDIVL